MKNIVFLFILLFSQIAIGQDNSNQIIESQGFNLNSLFRGSWNACSFRDFNSIEHKQKSH